MPANSELSAFALVLAFAKAPACAKATALQVGAASRRCKTARQSSLFSGPPSRSPAKGRRLVAEDGIEPSTLGL